MSEIKALDFGKNQKLFVASHGGANVGHVVATPAIDGVRITDLYVQPQARKLGIASSLIDEVKKRNKGNTLRLRARPYGVKGPKLVQLKDFYRKMGFTDDIAANDTMLQKVARLETLDKQANLYHTLAMIISPHRVADILTNLFTRQRKKFPGLYSTLSRSGIEAGWKGERPGVAAPVLMLSGASPALSGALDYGFGLLAGSQARKNYLKQMKQYGQYLTPRQQQLLVHRLPPVSALTDLMAKKPGAVHRLMAPLREEVVRPLPASIGGRVPSLEERIKQLNQAQQFVGRVSPLVRAQAAKITPADVQSALVQPGPLESPALHYMREAVEKEPSPFWSKAVSAANKVPLFRLLARSRFPVPGASLLMGAGASANIEGALGSLVALSSSEPGKEILRSVNQGLLGGVFNALPGAMATERANIGRTGLLGKAKSSLFLTGLRQARGKPMTRRGDRPNLFLSAYEPSARETMQAGRDIGNILKAQMESPDPNVVEAARKTRRRLDSLIREHSRPSLAQAASADYPWLFGKPYQLYHRAKTRLFGPQSLRRRVRNWWYGFPRTPEPAVQKPKLYGQVSPTSRGAGSGSTIFTPALSPEELAKSGAAELPYRERAELIGMIKGRLPVLQYPHGGIGFYGGGVDPGEDPAEAARREFFEESGLTAENVRPSGVPPVKLEWSKEMQEENPALAEKAKKWRGSMSHYFLGDIPSKRRKHKQDLDPAKHTPTVLAWLTPEEALKKLEEESVDDARAVTRAQFKPVSEARVAALKKLIEEMEKKASADLPYRERVELIGMRDGKVLGIKFPHGVFVFPGGGVDPGEDPMAAAAREIAEETGYPISNVRPAGVPPVIHEWTAENIARSPKLKERAKQFRGSSTQFFLGDVGRRRHKEIDADVEEAVRKLVWGSPEQALRRISRNPKADPTSALEGEYRESDLPRVAVLKKLIEAQTGKTASLVKQALSAPRAYALAKRLGILPIPGTDWRYGTKMMAKAEAALQGKGLGRRMSPELARETYMRRAGMATDAEVAGLRRMYERLRTHPEDLMRRAVRQAWPGKIKNMDAARGTLIPLPGQIAEHELLAMTPRVGAKPILRAGGLAHVPSEHMRGPALLAKEVELRREIDRWDKRVGKLLTRRIEAGRAPPGTKFTLSDHPLTLEKRLEAAQKRLMTLRDELYDFRDYRRIDPTRIVHTHPLGTLSSKGLRNVKAQPWRTVIPSGVPGNIGFWGGTPKAESANLGAPPALHGYARALGDMGSLRTETPMRGNLPVIQPEFGLMGASKITTSSFLLPHLNRFFVRQIKPFEGRMGEAAQPSLAKAVQFFKKKSSTSGGTRPPFDTSPLGPEEIGERVPPKLLPVAGRTWESLWENVSPYYAKVPGGPAGARARAEAAPVPKGAPAYNFKMLDAKLPIHYGYYQRDAYGSFNPATFKIQLQGPFNETFLHELGSSRAKTNRLKEHELTHGWQYLSQPPIPSPKKNRMLTKEEQTLLDNSPWAKRVTPKEIGFIIPPAAYYNKHSELDARLAEIKRHYVASHPGVDVNTPEEAAKAINWAYNVEKNLDYTKKLFGFSGNPSPYSERHIDSTGDILKYYEQPEEDKKVLWDYMIERMPGLLQNRQQQRQPPVKEASADFAPGLPDRSRFGDVEKLPKEKALKFVVQEHLARRAGRHYDVRMGTPETGLLSWATKKEWPGPGGKIMLFQQPVHRYEYGDFQGTLPKGYGAGVVKTHDKGAVLVTHASQDKIKFIVAHKGTPEYYTLVRRSGPPTDPKTPREQATQGGNWLLINTTPTDVKKWMGIDPDDAAKLRYKSIPAEEVEKLFTQGNIVQNKIDGASMLYRLFDDRIEATSYRVSKEGRPIIHTQRLFGPGGMKLDVPKEHVGTVLRGEAYGAREGKAIPPQELGGLLNASVIKSLENQRAKNVQMRSMLFDVAGEQDKPYAERLAKLERIRKFLPEHFHLPESARTPEESRALWEKIRSGSHPLTHEGIVAWPETGAPTKAKLMPESDVWIRNVFPGEGKYKGLGAGGFEYSLGPEGDVVGRVGTGFSDEARREMLEHPEAWVGRLARIRAQEKFPSGAFRAPAFIARHEDYPTKSASAGVALPLALHKKKEKKASLIGEVKRRALAYGD